MFMAFMSLVIVASAALFGGRLPLLARIQLRHSAAIVAALLVQIVIIQVIANAPRAVLVPLHLATYLVAAYFVWVNRSLPGLVLIGVGALCNGVTIALNGGTLPASAAALRAAGWPVDDPQFVNSSVLAHPVLPWLGDIVATPAWLPFRNVISIGDMIILLGAAVLVHCASESRPAGWCARLLGAGRRSGDAARARQGAGARRADQIGQPVVATSAAGAGIGGATDGLDGIRTALDRGDDLVVGDGRADAGEHRVGEPPGSCGMRA
jgi:hypothetical protein